MVQINRYFFNFFHFTVDTDTATTGEVKGGGVGCSVGPVTLSA